MSSRLISRSADLARLVSDGYGIEVRGGHVLMHDVPCLTPDGEVGSGTLVSTLDLAGDVTAAPRDHKMWFSGPRPSEEGEPIRAIHHSSRPVDLGGGLVAHHMFSARVRGGYRDYHHKFTTYLGHIVKPLVTLGLPFEARTFRPAVSSEGDGPFLYLDTATTRAGIGQAVDRLTGQKVAIVGTGGTGSYVLDFVAKTPVAEVHLFDDDTLRQHNAFRMPGAPSLDDLQRSPSKVSYLAEQYGRMRRGVVPHEERVDPELSAFGELRFDFVFLCVDSDIRVELAGALTQKNVPFVDAGLGLSLDEDGRVQGIVRVSSWRPGEPPLGPEYIPPSTSAGDLYESNIQVAELNALAATYAVAVWKRHAEFYLEVDRAPMYGFLVDQLRTIVAVVG